MRKCSRLRARFRDRVLLRRFAEAMLVGLPACCSYVGGMPGLAVDCEEAVFSLFW